MKQVRSCYHLKQQAVSPSYFLSKNYSVILAENCKAFCPEAYFPVETSPCEQLHHTDQLTNSQLSSEMTIRSGRQINK